MKIQIISKNYNNYLILRVIRIRYESKVRNKGVKIQSKKRITERIIRRSFQTWEESGPDEESSSRTRSPVAICGTPRRFERRLA